MTIVTAMVLTAGLVAETTGGYLARGSGDRVLTSVSIDTRTLEPGALFVALRGERVDGHRFIGEAVARGAAGVLVADDTSTVLAGRPREAAATIVVPDTLVALQQLGHAIRVRAGTRVVAVTGSAGKTSTKEITATLLESRYRVFRNAGNFNNHIGLPLSLTALTGGYDVAVVELGMNHAGEIRTLVELAEPDVRVWTNVGDAHIGHFGSRERIADAKAEILEHAHPADLLVVNADDPLVRARAARWTGRRISAGLAADADVRATHVVDRGLDGTAARVDTPAGSLVLEIPLAGRAQLANVLLAVAVATDLGVANADLEARVRALRPVAHRGVTLRLASGIRVVDDSYNASPVAVQAMLSALAATPTTGRRVAILGEMLELGDASRALHEVCGRAAVEAGVAELVAVGGEAADGFVDGARAAGLDTARIHRFADSHAAAEAVPALLRSGDVVLVKGSHGTRTDRIVDRLRATAGDC